MRLCLAPEPRDEGDRAAEPTGAERLGRGARGFQVVGDRGERQQAQHAGGRIDHRAGGHDACDAAEVDLGSRGVGHDDLHPAQVVGGGVGDRVERVAPAVGEHGIGQRAERCRDRGLESGVHPEVFGDQTANTRQARAHQRGGPVLLVERERQGGGAGGEGVALALERVEILAQLLDEPLGLEHVGLRELVRLVEAVLTRVADLGVRLARSELGARFLATLGRGVEGVLLPQHFTAHRRQALRGRLRLTVQLADLQIVLGDQRALRRDLLVDRVESGTSAARARLGGLPRGLGLCDSAAQALDLVCGVLHHLRADPWAVVGGLGLAAEQREALRRQGVQAAEPILRLLEGERRAARDVHGVADLGLLQARAAQLLLLQLLLQDDLLAVALRL